MARHRDAMGVFKATLGCYNRRLASSGIGACAAVAQLVEQRIRNAKVTSSIPVSGTKKSIKTKS